MKEIDAFIKNPKSSLIKISIPAIMGMLAQTFYNIIDTAFVGRLGSDALAAITFSFPVFFILIAINLGVLTGMSSKISRSLGSNDMKSAENSAMHGILLSIISAIVLCVVGNIFIDEILLAFGAAEVLGLAKSYLELLLYAALFMYPVYVINYIFSSQGDTKIYMIMQMSALGLNVILDYIFIFPMGMGIRGAGLATLLAFAAALVASVIILYSRSKIRIRFKSFVFTPPIFKEIVKVGFPASLTLLSLSVNLMFINWLMATFSSEHVAFFGVMSRLQSVAMLPIVGLSVGLMTLVGMFYGAKRSELVKKVSGFGLTIGLVISCTLALGFYLFPEWVYRLFTDDPKVIELGATYLRVAVITFPLMALTNLSTRVMQGLGLGMPGLVINIVRVFLFAIPLGYYFVIIANKSYMWVAYAMVIGAVGAALVGLLWLRKSVKKDITK